MKIIVIVSDFGAAAHMGATVETKARSFQLPEEVAEYITKHRGEWTTVSLAIEDEKL